MADVNGRVNNYIEKITEFFKKVDEDRKYSSTFFLVVSC